MSFFKTKSKNSEHNYNYVSSYVGVGILLLYSLAEANGFGLGIGETMEKFIQLAIYIFRYVGILAIIGAVGKALFSRGEGVNWPVILSIIIGGAILANIDTIAGWIGFAKGMLM